MNDLPPLYEATLDETTLAALFDDIDALGTGVEVLPRRCRRQLVGEETPRLFDALRQIRTGELDGLQLRYEHQGERWFDTLTRSGDGVWRLVRLNATSAASPAPPITV